jgi:hypothetical protein
MKTSSKMVPFIKPCDFEHYDLPPSWQDDTYEITTLQQERIRSIKIRQTVIDSICFITSCIIVVGLIALMVSTGKL